MDPEPSNEPILTRAAQVLGDRDAIRLLSELVAIAPTNLEDPVHRRWEKAHYPRAADRIVRAAREFGLATRVYDPVADPHSTEEFHGLPRPNVVVDLDRGLPRRLLLLAHFDVVPVPEEQLTRWKSPPHVLTARSDGRLYGRGANDDLGSGVVASLIALRRLTDRAELNWNVRLVACCDEETGGSGGIEAIKARDDRLPEGDPDRILLADAALIPDGDPHTSAASSGVAFGDASFPTPVAFGEAVAFGRALVELHGLARAWKSAYPSPDWPDHAAPESVVTGRASVTRFDLKVIDRDPAAACVTRAHAETDASNQIAEAVTVLLSGPASGTDRLASELAKAVTTPFRWIVGGRTGIPVHASERLFQLAGQSAHGGYPHRGHNPVPALFDLLELAFNRGWLDRGARVEATYGVDLRFPPEQSLHDATSAAQAEIARWIGAQRSKAQLVFPPDRCRGGYAVPLDHPLVRTVDRILSEAFGEAGVFGEYGGTDASSLVGVRTPAGGPLPAVVFGSMDRMAHIHEAEESVDPRLLAGVIQAIERFATEP